MAKIPDKAIYPSYIDYKPGFFLNWFLYRLFKRVSLDANMVQELKRMNRVGTVVYAIKYPGHLDYLLYHYRYLLGRLPYPKIAFDFNMLLFMPLSQVFKIVKSQIAYFFKHGSLPNPYKTGFFHEAISEGTTALLSLVDPKGFTRHFLHAERDPIHFLLETQMDMERPIYVVPQLVLYKKTPERESSSFFNIFFGYKDNPGLIRKVVLFFRHNRHAFIDFGHPLDLKDYLRDKTEIRSLAEIAGEVREKLISSIDSQKRVILGPIMKSRQQLKESVLMDPDITRMIDRMGKRHKKGTIGLKKQAGEYFDEIAADYNANYIALLQILLSWFWKKIFQGIDLNPAEIATVREWARRGPLIYVPSHKSHIDYLVLNYVLYVNHMHVPRIAAGQNLAFWPMGHIFRKAGAFFIRRTFKGARLYPLVLNRYIKALLREGHPLEFYIEGGRSRSGKLVLPKMGFLSILLQAQKEGYCRDLVFVPASISYDRILDEKSYLKEVGGEQKEKESFSQVLKARHFLKKKHGKIYIRFAQPLSLQEYLKEAGDGRAVSHTDLAFHLIRSINAVTLVTPLSLMALAILTSHRRGFHFGELRSTAEFLLQTLVKDEARLAPSLCDLDRSFHETLELLISWKLINCLEGLSDEEIFYYVDDEKKRELEYYKNSIVHYFISYGFVAASILTGTDEIKRKEEILADYHFLRHLFKYEFIYSEENKIEAEVSRIHSYFEEHGLVVRTGQENGSRVTRKGFDRLPIWATLAKTFLESYWIATRAFLDLRSKAIKRGDLPKHMAVMGLRFHKLGIVSHVESISQINYKNAIHFINEEIISVDGEPGGDQQSANQMLSELSQNIERFTRFGTS
jgi:glycerol-3-phosphate O-acyltransferase